MTTRLVFISLVTAGVAFGQPPSPWKLSAAGALSAADGNSDALSYSLQLLGIYDTEEFEARVGFDHFYAEEGSVVSSENYKLHQQLGKPLNESWYLSQYASALNDSVADIDYRLDGSLSLGRHLLRTDRVRLSIEAGPGYAWEKKGGISENYMTARLAQRLEIQLSDEARLWQSLAWTPRVEDPGDAILEWEVGLENRLTNALAFRTFVRHRVDTAPALASGRSDTAVMVGLKYEFAGEEEDLPAPQPDPAGALLNAALGLEGDWQTSAAFGLTLNRGNADSAAVALDWTSDYNSQDWELAWELGYDYAEDKGQTSTDRVTARLQGNRYLDGPVYLGAGLGFLRDEPAAVEYRLTPSVVIGRALIRNERTRLAFEAGPELTIEKTGNGSDLYPSLRVAERFRHRFSERISLKQSVEATAAVEDAERFILSSKLALDSKLTESLTWRWELESRYENLPAAGRDHHDLLLTSAIAVSF